jgi:hypothetical protein
VHQQVDARARRRDLVERVDQLRIGAGVELEDDSRRPVGTRMVALAAQAAEELVPEVERCRQQLPIRALTRDAGQEGR